MCLSSIQTLNWRIVSQLHPSPISPILISRCASQLNPGPISTPSRSRDVCLLSAKSPRFAFLLCLRWILPHSGSWYLHLAYILITSRLHPDPPNCIFVPSKRHPKPIQVSWCVSPPSRSFPNWGNVSQLHPSPISPYSHLNICISTQSRSHLNPIQVSRFVSPIHPGSQINASYLSQLNLTSIWDLIFTSHLHPGNISPPSRSNKLHLSSIQASSQTHTSFKVCVSPPSRSFINWIIVSQLHPSPISPYPRLKTCISNQSRSHLNPIQVSGFVSPIHPGSQIHVASLSQLNPTSFWVVIFTSRLHPNNISPPSWSTKLHLSSIQASSQTHTGFMMCLTSIQVLSQLENCISAPS